MMRHTRLILAALLALGPLSAIAVPITGEITISGDVAPTGGSGLGDATGLDFIGDDFNVNDATGDFAAAGIGAGDIGFIQDFQFNPLLAPISPLWSIGGFSFTLQTIAIDYQGSYALVLSGVGFLSNAVLELDDTPGTWTLTANGAGGTIFNFSAGTGTPVTPVPEPTTLALLGIGLVGLGLSRRRKKI